MTDKPLSTGGEPKFTAGDRAWVAPAKIEPFLDWLDDQEYAQDTNDAMVEFMKLQLAKLMPETLKDDLRREGYL
jgi:hypothetical protein